MCNVLACRHPADIKKEKEDILKRLNAKVKLVFTDFITSITVNVCLHTAVICRDIIVQRSIKVDS